jgi:hypothetical protein
MFRPSMGVIIRPIENYQFLKIHEMYVCLMGLILSAIICSV